MLDMLKGDGGIPMQTKASRKKSIVDADVMAALAADREQEELAERRMGRTPEDRLRWLVAFTQQDLNGKYPEERIASDTISGCWPRWAGRHRKR